MKSWARPNSVLLLMTLLLLPCGVVAHGVKGEIAPGTEAMMVMARYSNDEAMSYAETTIRPPSGEIDFQTGRTDRNGRFCFFPDAEGDWEVIVDDGMGHRLRMVVPVSKNRPPASDLMVAPSAGNSVPLITRAFSGLGIIFGISGCLMWWRTRKLHQETP